jgi:hypothetical protein
MGECESATKQVEGWESGGGDDTGPPMLLQSLTVATVEEQVGWRAVIGGARWTDCGMVKGFFAKVVWWLMFRESWISALNSI